MLFSVVTMAELVSGPGWDRLGRMGTDGDGWGRMGTDGDGTEQGC